MKKLINYLFVILSFFLLDCASKESNKSNTNNTHEKLKYESVFVSNCRLSIVNDTLRQNILPLNYNVFDTLLIKEIFKIPNSTSLEKPKELGSSFVYTIKSGNSEVFFSGNNYYQKFYLDYAKILDNSVRLNYNISIGMDRKTFFQNIKQSVSECDSIIILDDTSSNLFLFNNDMLQMILVTTGI